MSESYEGKQIVGMDLHRRRSVLVRMTDTGQRLETVRISNDPAYLRDVMGLFDASIFVKQRSAWQRWWSWWR